VTRRERVPGPAGGSAISEAREGRATTTVGAAERTLNMAAVRSENGMPDGYEQHASTIVSQRLRVIMSRASPISSGSPRDTSRGMYCIGREIT
jgi:hypothetical protein